MIANLMLVEYLEFLLGVPPLRTNLPQLSIFHLKELLLVLFFVTNNVVFAKLFGHKYPLAPISSAQDSGGVIDSISQSASAADLLPGNLSALDKILKTYLVVRLQDDSLCTISHHQFYSYLIDAQDSQCTQMYLNLLDVHILFEDLTGLHDFVIVSDVCFSADFKQKLVAPKNHSDAMARSNSAAWKGDENKRF